MNSLTKQSAFFAMVCRRVILVVVVAFGFLFGSVNVAQAATITWDGGGGDNNWSTCANWSGDTCPTSADTALFNGTSAKNSTVDAGFAGSVLQVNISGYAGVITMARSLDIGASGYNQTSGTFNAGSNALTVGLSFTLSGGTFTAPSTTMTVTRAFTVSGSPTFNANGGTVVFAQGASDAVSCNNITFNLVSFTHTSGTKTASGNCSFPLGSSPTIPGSLHLSGTVSGSGTLTLGAGSTLTFNGASAVLSGFSGLSTGSLVVQNSAVLNAGSYTTFIASSSVTQSSGTLTMPSGTDIGILSLSGGTLNLSSGNTFIGGAITITGSPTINQNGGTITLDGGSVTYSCNGYSFTSVVLAGSGTKQLTNCSLNIGANPVLTGVSSNSLVLNVGGILIGSGTLTIPALTLNNATSQISGFTGFVSPVSGSALTISNATVDFSGYTTFDIEGTFAMSSGTFTAPAGTMYIGGALNLTGGTFNANGGTIVFDTTTTATITCNNATFNNVSFAHTANVKTVSSNCSLPLGNNPTIGTGTAQLTLSGTLTGSGTLTTQNHLRLNAGATLTGFTGYSTLGNLTVQGGTMDLSSYSTFAVGSTTSLTSGSLAVPTNADLNALTISGGAFTAPTGTMSVAGNMTISGSSTFNANGGTIIFDGNSATLSCNNATFSTVQFDMPVAGNPIKFISSNCSFNLGHNPEIRGGVSLSGTLSGSGTLYKSTDYGSFLLNTGGALTGFSGLISNASLTIAGANADFSDYTLLDINDDLRLNSGSFTAPTGEMSILAEITHSTGTFNHNGGTVILDGTTQIISGSHTFNNLRKIATTDSTLTFAAGTTQTVLGTLTLQGADTSNLLTLNSSTPGTQWSINAQGARALQFLDVQDANNAGSTTLTALCSIDSGNNDDWLFPTCTGSLFTLVSPSDRVYIRDERPTFSWRPPSDRALFSAAREYSLVVDTGTTTNFKIEGIPAQRPGNGSIYETETYRVEYLNWDNDDLGDNMISLVTKPASSWSNDYNDGKLTEGKRNWRVQLKDSGNSVYEMSNELFVDFTPPTTSISKINTLDYVPAVLTSDTTPTIFGKVTDPLMGSGEDRKVAAGPKSITIMIEKKNSTGYESIVTDTISLSKSFWSNDGKEIDTNTENFSDKFSPFEYTPIKSLSDGTYRITLKPADNVDNSFATQMFQIRVGAYDDITATLADEQKSNYQQQINETDKLITIPDPNEDQQAIEQSFSEELKQKNDSASSEKLGRSKSKKTLILGVSILGALLWWFFIIWKKRKKKKQDEK